MRRRRWIISVAIILVFLTGVGIFLGWTVKHEPRFYRDSGIASGPERTADFDDAVRQWSEIQNAIVANEPRFEATFTARQINAFLQEQDDRSDNNFFSSTLHHPRVQIEDGLLRIGVRYGTGTFSTILSIDLRLWLVAGESNMIALEIVSLKAGALPISTSALLDYISDNARKQGADITWYRHDGHPTAVMRLQAQWDRPTFQLERCEMRNDRFVMQVRSTDADVPAPRVVDKKP